MASARPRGALSYPARVASRTRPHGPSLHSRLRRFFHAPRTIRPVSTTRSSFQKPLAGVFVAPLALRTARFDGGLFPALTRPPPFSPPVPVSLPSSCVRLPGPVGCLRTARCALLPLRPPSSSPPPPASASTLVAFVTTMKASPPSPFSSVSAFFATASPSARWRAAYAANVAYTIPFTIYAILHGIPATCHLAALPGQAAVAASHRLLFSSHSAGAVVYAAAALIQFHAGIRRTHRALHRASGYLFVAVGTVLAVGGGTGMAAHTYTRFPGGVVATLTAAMSLVALIAGVAAARDRRLADHRDWMTRHYGVTWGLVAGSRVVPVLLSPAVIVWGVPDLEVMQGAWIISLLGGMLAAEVVIATTPRGGGEGGARRTPGCTDCGVEGGVSSAKKD